MRTILLLIAIILQTTYIFAQVASPDESKPMTVQLILSPFSADAILLIDKHFKDATVTLYNAFGQAIEEVEKFTGESISFYRDDLLTGEYFLKVTEDNKTIITNKFALTE